jgi:1-deoxy-D-xylulose-5-phosphate synthase
MKILKNFERDGLTFDVVNARFVKPLDTELLQSLESEYVITLEDNMLFGGFGLMVNAALNDMNKTCKVKNFAYKDEFIPQGGVSQLQALYGDDENEIEKYILDVLK